MPNVESILDAAFQDALRCSPSELPETQRAIIRENLRLQFDYPGQYVAFVDDWTDGYDGRSLSRSVIYAGSDYPEVWESTRSHPRVDEIAFRYAADPDEEIDAFLAD